MPHHVDSQKIAIGGIPFILFVYVGHAAYRKNGVKRLYHKGCFAGSGKAHERRFSGNQEQTGQSLSTGGEK